MTSRTANRCTCLLIGAIIFMTGLITGWMAHRWMIADRPRIEIHYIESPPETVEVPALVPVGDDIGFIWPTVRDALNCLRKHESLNGTQMTGDNGAAEGWLQQHCEHWKRGCEFLGVSWKWPEDTRDLRKCEWVAVGNWLRDHRQWLEAGSEEMLIRTFRLPFAPNRRDNDQYLQLVLGRRD